MEKAEKFGSECTGISAVNGLDSEEYPVVDALPISPTLHDIIGTQELLRNPNNYTSQSTCEVFEIREDLDGCPVGTWSRLYGRDFGAYLEFCPSLFGEPDYCAPLALRTLRYDGTIERADYCYQHTRYDTYIRRDPCSVYFYYDAAKLTTVYVITSGKDEDWVRRAKNRLTDYYVRDDLGMLLREAESHDPFLIQSILCHESLLEGRRFITQLRTQTYMAHEVVKVYSQTPPEKRSNLTAITQELYKLSKDADSLLGSADMQEMVQRHCIDSRNRLLNDLPKSQAFSTSNVGDSLRYLNDSLGAQKRWIQSYKSRKETAMTFVFNMVTQQDSKTNEQIARDMKRDSASMKAIAVLTMVFLPATAVSGFFGMGFFDLSDQGDLVVSPLCWIFVATTLPLTLTILMLWMFWDPISKRFNRTRVPVEDNLEA